MPPLLGRCLALTFAPDGRGVAVSHAGTKPGVRFWDLHGPLRERDVLPAAGTSLLSLAFTPDNKELAAVGSDRKIHFWGLGSATPASRPPLAEPTDQPRALGFSPDGMTLAVLGSKEGQTALWDRSKALPKLLLSLGGGPACRVNTLAFAPDGRSVAVAGDGTESLSWWELPSGRKLRSWSLPGQVLSVEFAADGRHLLTVNSNGTAYLFRLASPPVVAKK